MTDVLELFRCESEDEDEFLGFNSSDFNLNEKFTDCNLLKDDSNSKSSGFFSNESLSSDESSDEEIDLAAIKKQRMEILHARKIVLNTLMAEVRNDRVYKELKNQRFSNTPTKKRRVRRDSSFMSTTTPTRINPIITRRRSKLGGDALEEGIKDERETHRSRLVIRFKFQKRRCENDGDNDREYQPKKRRVNSKIEHEIVPVEDITENMLANIAQYSVGKKYDAINGTSCHQCRQKTTDTKSCCRSKDCVGVRGQFCGPCLKNRYGELVEDALLDPDWVCPVCRGFCNCSICRNRDGKCATGILIGIAKHNGYSNVKDYLASLNNNRDEE